MGEKNMKRSDHLEPDGNLEADTETGVKYRGEQGSKQGPLKRGDYIQPSSAKLDGETETSRLTLRLVLNTEENRETSRDLSREETTFSRPLLDLTERQKLRISI